MNINDNSERELDTRFLSFVYPASHHEAQKEEYHE